MFKLKFLSNLRRWVIQFIAAYFVSFPFYRLPAAMPFLLLVISAAVCYGLFRAEDKGLRAQKLENQLKAAYSREDFETARVVLQRKLNLSPNSRDLRYDLAQVHLALEQPDKAKQIMRALAYAIQGPAAIGDDDDSEVGKSSQADRARGRGDIRAARWLLEKQFVGRPWSEMSDAEKNEAGYLLQWISSNKPDDLAVRAMYADFLLQKKRFGDALAQMQPLIAGNPLYGLQAAIVAQGNGMADDAKDYARQALRAATTIAQNEPNNVPIQGVITQCHLILQQHEEAVRSLQAALQRAQTDQQKQEIGQALGGTLVAWIDYRESKEAFTKADRLWAFNVLQRALQFAPNNPLVMEMVTRQVMAAANQENEQLAAMKEALVQGIAPGFAHFIEGTVAAMNDDADKALLHLELASKTMPSSGLIMNNLAFVLANRPEPQLERALQISEQAIRSVKNPEPHYYETRGQILYKLGRHRDAISDLEIGLAIPELKGNVHRSLAECYQQIGQAELSAVHTKEAEELDQAKVVK